MMRPEQRGSLFDVELLSTYNLEAVRLDDLCGNHAPPA